MFLLCCCCGKKSTSVTDVVADQSRQTRTSQRSVAVPDASAATGNKDERSQWRFPLFGRPFIKEIHPEKEKQNVATSDDKTTGSKQKAKKPRWWHRCKKRRQVAPAVEEQSLKERCHSTPHQDEVVEFKGLTKEEERLLEEDKKVPPTVPKKEEEDAVSTTNIVRHQQGKCHGLPNPAQICYMNSCLQSLLTLEDFVRAISGQEQVWSLIPEATLMRSFMDIKGSHLSSDARHKINLLDAFKKAVSVWAPEFQDLHQKDAHEFLTSVLEQMRCLGPRLQGMAASMGRVYSCPVEDHLVFKMQNTRTCKRCSAGSTREEEFTNLSLDLVPGGTVEQMLQDYLMETQLEYKCVCGATTSGQRSSFVTLPRVLVLHLKRFRFSPSFQLEKVCDPVVLFRELVVSSNQGGGCYSLVSTISHIGLTARSGHYISDGTDLDVGMEDPTDRWFTYNDAEVTETSGDSVCDQRQKNAYILFYKRHVRVQHCHICTEVTHINEMMWQRQRHKH
ncbi:ubiquitin carboxyl-terminal hydrolase 37-like isoform X2 [Siniperca chuatsi]|uniref:ubiquitin carboxyl-terminal hydrolase 37-like isoform X2 n=1 Tax=Siniperca chuatsi TaxID=119488 RepID=UPI001CE1CCE6|nr:ubiquitin carboxyl-terminal hydrolase 37-like isoform X2 [Siniperca chuatsi]